MSNLAENLRTARERQGWTQEYVAEVSGVGGGICALSHWESGRRVPNVENLRRLAIALRVTTDWLLGMRGPRKHARRH